LPVRVFLSFHFLIVNKVHGNPHTFGKFYRRYDEFFGVSKNLFDIYPGYNILHMI